MIKKLSFLMLCLFMSFSLSAQTQYAQASQEMLAKFSQQDIEQLCEVAEQLSDDDKVMLEKFLSEYKKGYSGITEVVLGVSIIVFIAITAWSDFNRGREHDDFFGFITLVGKPLIDSSLNH